MSEETTQNMDGNRSFEERIFARFDNLDSRLQVLEQKSDNLDSRLQRLEQKSYDTKPIWERALAEIVEVKAEIVEVKERLTSLERLSDQIVRKIDVLGKDMLTLRAD